MITFAVMKTRIEINGLKLYGFHGVIPQERLVGNVFVFDISLTFKFDEAIYDDDITSTVNYARIVELVRHINETPSNLLEHVALRIRDLLVDRFHTIQGGTIRVAKLTPPIPSCELDSVAAVIEW